MVQSCIGRDDKAGLSEYIEIYKTELPPDIREIYCRSQVINALICYYASQARRHKIRFEAQADYPEQCPVSDTEVTVILGNLLENAVEARLCEKNVKCSIREIADRYGGDTLFEQKAGMFYASVWLQIPEEADN